MSSFPDKSHPGAPVLPVDAVVVGEVLVDLFAEPGQDLESADRFTRHLGGAAANLAVGLSRQGVPAALLAMVGGDPFGRFVRRRLHEEGVVGDGLSQHRTARTGAVFIGAGSGGRAAFLPYRQGAADLLIGPGEMTPALLTRGRVLGIGSASLVQEPARAAVRRAVELMRAAGRIVFCDVNFRPHQWSDAAEGASQVRHLLSAVDVVKLSADELPALFGTTDPEAAAAKARRLGCRIVVVTQGQSGCYIDSPAGQAFLAGEVVRVVDRTGAGDAFSAGLVAGLLRALPRQGAPTERLGELSLQELKQACAQANHLGARCCTAIGATAALPRLTP